jgi:hypothetical protein
LSEARNEQKKIGKTFFMILLDPFPAQIFKVY